MEEKAMSIAKFIRKRWQHPAYLVVAVSVVLLSVVAAEGYIEIRNADCLAKRKCTSSSECFVEKIDDTRYYFCCKEGSLTFKACRRGSSSTCYQSSKVQMVDCKKCYRGTSPCKTPCPGGNKTIDEIRSCL